MVGDFYSLAACNEVGHRRLIDMMSETGMGELVDLGEFIFSRSRAATLERIAALPKGSWQNEMTVDGYDVPVNLATTLSVKEATR